MRFCGGCGVPIAEVAVEEERKSVAVLFADICDFTALVASRDPEETKDKIEACLKTMEDQVVAMDGVVEKFIGDAIMAVFGVPVAHDNDAERAVRAGLRILEHVRWFGASAGLDVELRLGVHFGEVIVSAHDRAPGREHHVFGEVVNLASRLEKSGEAGAVVASGDVYKRAQEFFDFEKLPEIKVKGVEEPLTRYRVLGEKTERGKLRGIRGLSAPMVGRDRELQRLVDLYQAAARGEGAKLAAVVGEAGIGKTRLTEELIHAVKGRGEGVRLLHGRCLAYTGAPPYLPFTQIIKRAAGVKDDMSLDGVRERLREALTAAWAGTKIGDVDGVEVLGELLAPGANGSRPSGRDTEQIRDQIFLVIERFLAATASERPILILIEDAQWADPSTLALLGHLARTVREARCLTVINSRPPEEYGGGVAALFAELAAYDHFTSVHLKDLRAGESRELVSALLEVEKLPAKTKGFIIERAAGNPFFVEEIIKSLIEGGVLVQRGTSWAATREIETLDIPDTIEGVLRARLDNLPREQKRLIQRASVVGEVFWRKIVAELMDQAVDDYLGDLERRDLIRPRLESLFEDDFEYIFKHTILHETVYNSILRRVRKNLHLRSAQWVERNYGDRIEMYLPLVAHHFERAGESGAAGEYYFRAAARAASLFANDDAKRFYDRAAANTRAPESLREIYLGRGDVCARTGDNYEAISNFEAAIICCRKAAEEAEVYHRLGEVYEKMSAYPKALDYFGLAEELLAGRPPNLTLARAYEGPAWVDYLKGEFEEALRHAEKAESVLAALGREDAAADMVRARLSSITGAVFHDAGQPDKARASYDIALALYEKHGNLFRVSSVLNNIGTTEATLGRLGSAIQYLERSYETGERAGNRFNTAVNCCNLGEIYVELGDYETARDYFNRYLEINTAVANRLGDGYAYWGLGRVAGAGGKEAEKFFLKAIAVFEEVGATVNIRLTKLSLVEFYAAAGRAREAETLIAELRGVEADGDLSRAEAVAAARSGWPPAAGDVEKYRGIAERGAKALSELKRVPERLKLAAALAILFTWIGEEGKGTDFKNLAEKIAGEMEADVDEEKLRESFRRRVSTYFSSR